MTIGVLSDTHLREPTKDFMKILEGYFSDVDMILHAGDYVDESILDVLMSRQFAGVVGNMDPPEVAKRLPEKRILNISGFSIGLIHGWGSPSGLENRVRKEFDQVDCIVYGHSHTPQNIRIDDVLFFNPGSTKGGWLSKSRTIGRLYVDRDIKGEIIRI